MTSQIPFTPLTAEALSRLTPDERNTFVLAAEQVAAERKPSMMTIAALVETVGRLIGEQQPEPREVKRLEASAAAGDALIREVLEALCRRDGLPLESSVVPGEPARNYDLAIRLGIGHVFGISEQRQAGVPAVPGVTAKALRAYMTATGWTEPDHEGGPAGKIWSKGTVSFGVPHTDAPDVLRSALDRLASAEGRSYAVVARTIAAVYGAAPKPAAASTETPGALPAAALGHAEAVTRLCPGCLHDGVLELTLERARNAEARLLELENATTWMTSCTSCARVLDTAYGETMRRREAEARLAAIRAVLLEGGQDDATARRRALAITGTGAESAPLTAAEAGRIARMVTGHENAVAAVRAGLDLAAPFADTDPAVIAAAREARKVLSGEEEADRG